MPSVLYARVIDSCATSFASIPEARCTWNLHNATITRSTAVRRLILTDAYVKRVQVDSKLRDFANRGD